jgi:NAD(P)-dependent dehydrogenase (short-subunit alcohol dehydrogenase family)
MTKLSRSQLTARCGELAYCHCVSARLGINRWLWAFGVRRLCTLGLQPWVAMRSAKAALESLVRYFAVTLAKRGITVNAIALTGQRIAY